MSEPRWLKLDEVIVAHERQLARFGGAPGLRDLGALESALDRPKNKWLYEQKGLLELASSYGFGLARNHPFVDGNKRVAFISLTAFLRLNRVRFAPRQDEATIVMLDLAAGAIDEDGLFRWIRDRAP
jgi:death-on-curing protein